MFWELERHAGAAQGIYDGASRSLLSYAQLLDQVRNVQALLPAEGKVLVALFADNSLASLTAYLATLRAGHALLLTGASTAPALQARILDAYQPEAILRTGEGAAPPPEGPGVTGAVAGVQATVMRREPQAPIHPDTALLLSTSGTTGSPKLARLSYRNVQANAESIARYLELSPAASAITNLPLSYSYGLSVVNSHLLVGAGLTCTNEALVSPRFWALFRERGCTALAGVPFTYALLERLGLEKMDLPSLRTLTQAGGCLAAEKVRWMADVARRRGWRFFVMYGQTEATARIAYLPWERLPEKAGAVGFAIPGGRIRVLGSEGETTPPGTEGEIVYEGPNVMLGYAESRADLARGDELDGVLRTGDLGHLDAEGCLHITGRLKRFLKLFGLRLNLDEVERMLETALARPVACVGDDQCLEVVVEAADDALLATARARLTADYGLPAAAVRVRSLAVVLRNGAGKKDYAALGAARRAE